MATITIDARLILGGGIGTYLQTLLDELAASAWRHTLFALIRAKENPKWKNSTGITGIPVRSSIYSLSEHWEIPLAAPRGSLLHVPHYNIPFFFKGPIVANIHDLIHLQFPEYFRSAAAA